MKKKTRRALLVFFLLFFLMLCAAGWLVRYLLITPYKGYSASMIAVTIPPGTPVNRIAQTLCDRGVIRHPLLLKGLFIVFRTQGKSKAGDYVFDRPLSPMDVYNKLLKGEMQYRVLTVVEGSNLFDVQRVFEAKKIAYSGEFQQAILSNDVLYELNNIESGLNHVEGFLFPETYFLSKRENVIRAVVLMIRQFEKHFGEAEKSKARALGMTAKEVVTLASLIEKETAREFERPMISGVFHNRLKRSMLLQCDPTVIYSLVLLGKYRGYISRQDLQTSSPYNTYVSPGLPPGPICNPGKASIDAALSPAQTNMLYFVSKNDGSHYFSSTLQEHNRAVQLYQRHGK